MLLEQSGHHEGAPFPHGLIQSPPTGSKDCPALSKYPFLYWFDPKIIDKYHLSNLIQIQGMSSRIIIGFKNNLDS